MSRTANPPTCQQRPFIALALFIFAFCLVLHFLVEDMMLYSTTGSFAEATSAKQIPFEEAEHQDDIVMLADLPEYLLHNEPPAVYLLTNQREQQAYFPILTPPKIA
jgi:hypothetical protein